MRKTPYSKNDFLGCSWGSLDKQNNFTAEAEMGDTIYKRIQRGERGVGDKHSLHEFVSHWKIVKFGCHFVLNFLKFFGCPLRQVGSSFTNQKLNPVPCIGSTEF